MQPFTYATASNAEEASAKSTDAQKTLLGGGTCLVDLMKLDVMSPVELVDVRKIAASQIVDKGGSVLIPATASNSAVAHDSIIMANFPMLSEAILSGASPQLRNAATVAGNIMQRTRCYYYRDTNFRCNRRDPGSGCDAIEGYNRIHAVLGGSQNCIAVHPSDMCVAMVALDAVVHVQSGGSVKDIPLVDFHVLPGDHPEIETVLKPGDVIVSVEIPKTDLSKKSKYLKVRDRASFSFALTSAAVALNVRGGNIAEARLAMGGVGTKPWRSTAAEQALVGKAANRDTFKAAAEIALRDAVPHKHNKFKIELAKRTIVKAFEGLVS